MIDYIENIKKIAAKTFDVKVSDISDELSIGEIDGWDSVGNLNFIQALESELDVEIPVEDLFDLTSIKSIAEEINKLKNE